MSDLSTPAPDAEAPPEPNVPALTGVEAHAAFTSVVDALIAEAEKVCGEELPGVLGRLEQISESVHNWIDRRAEQAAAAAEAEAAAAEAEAAEAEAETPAPDAGTAQPETGVAQ